MLSEEDACPAGIACDPVDHDGDRRGDGFDRRPIRTLVEERGDLAEHVIADAIPRSNEQLIARLEALVEVSIVQPCAGAYAAHSDRGPTALTPNLGCGLDQLLPSLGTTLQGHVTLTTTGHSAALVFGSLAPTNTLLPNGFRQLIDTTGPVLLLGTVTDPTGFQLPIPAVGALDGLQLFTQAMHLGGQPDFALSNAVDLTLHW